MRALALFMLLSVAACGPAEQPPAPQAQAVTPQPIGYPDIEAHSLFGASCAYAEGTSMAPLVIAFADEAVMKIDGQIQRFRADPGSESAQLGTRTRYLGENRVLSLTIIEEGASSGYETVTFDGTVRLADNAGEILFEGAGGAQCGS